MVIGAKPWLADTQHPLYEAGKAAVKRGTTHNITLKHSIHRVKLKHHVVVSLTNYKNTQNTPPMLPNNLHKLISRRNGKEEMLQNAADLMLL